MKYMRSISGNYFVVADGLSATPPSPGNESWMEGCWRGRPVSVISAAVSAADGGAQARGFNDELRERRQTTVNP